MPTTTNLVLREDTLLGVCQGLGEDFSFNPNWLRIAFGAVLVVNPMIAIGTYLALGAAVMLARFGWPAKVADEVPTPQALPIIADNDAGLDLAKAA